MPERTETPGDQIQPIRFHGLGCRFCHEGLPHPRDIAKHPDPEPGSVWSLLLDDLGD